jgi:uncharacterized protein
LFDTLRFFMTDTGDYGLTLAGLLVGLAFGALTQATNFCTMGGISDWILMGDTRRLRAWALAAATAIIGVALLRSDSALNLSFSESMYVAPRLNWASHLIGGALFGVGMVLAGGCASRNVVRAGTGDVRALVTLMIMSLFATMTFGGVLAPLRVALDSATAIPLSTPSTVTEMLGALALGTPHVLPFIIAGLIAAVCFSSAAFRSDRRSIFAGLGIGLLVTLAWMLTTIGTDPLDERIQVPVALSFVKPSSDTLDWLQRSTALGLPSFAVSTIFGTALGAALAAFFQGRLGFQIFESRSGALQNLSGAALMGIGGVMALGCSIGQGVSGLSTLSLGSMLTIAAMIVGAVATIKALEKYTA